MRVPPRFLLCLLLASLPALAQDPVEPVTPPPGKTTAAVVDPRLPAEVVRALKKVAGTYPKWGLVDHEARRAPWLCRMPIAPTAKRSAARAGTPHARKLYGLFAIDPQAYASSPIFLDRDETWRMKGFGQAIVKETFHPKRYTTEAWAREEEKRGEVPYEIRSRELRPLIEKDHVLVPGKPGPLFVMLQVPAGTPGSDAGWVYATFDRKDDKRTLTAAGVIGSCKTCHEQAPHGRLFGMKGFGKPTDPKGWPPADEKKTPVKDGGDR